ncbi:MAG: GGDEF domain-containing protein [Firmicutes bacterium HGW-Firmicutes-15]|nr:MAG: GGDEF domain-containing protein [Firmicutes bacterium HGW-Firmicutes-15]
MINDLFVNACILIAIIGFANQILINKDITPSASLKYRLFLSSMLGLLGILLMVNSVQVFPGVIIDFRNIAIISSATYCGMGPAIITAIIIAVFRLLYAGLTYPSIVAAITTLTIGIGSGLIIRLIISKTKQWVYMSLMILMLPSIALYMLINNQTILIESLITYCIGTSIISTLVFFYLKYINISQDAYRKYQLDSSVDYRTGLNNVRKFEIELNKIIKGLTEKSIITMIYIDIDFFKEVNDTYGHQNGDKILEEIGKIILNSSSYSDIVSRIGGEEFSVLMMDCPRDKVLEVAERIRKTVQEHKFPIIDGQEINITVSIGVAIYPETVNDINMIIEKADEALYQAKRTGRNRVVLAS